MLIRFFFMLREGGLKPSITELLTLLGAMKAGVAGQSVDDFYYLSRAALVKDESQFDRFDRQILEVLQSEGRISNQELADRIGLSPSPCLRRVRALEESGIIDRYAALVNQPKVGLPGNVFVNIALHREVERELEGPLNHATGGALVGDEPGGWALALEHPRLHHFLGEAESYLLVADANDVGSRHDVVDFDFLGHGRCPPG